MDRQHDALVSLFTERLIVSNLALGALMDISEHAYPTVTVEVGGRLDEAAQRLATEGLARYLTQGCVLAQDNVEHSLELLLDPIRLELNPGVSLTYADSAAPDADITLLPDIERLNFGAVRPDVVLGWARGEARRLFTARDAGGRCAVARLVRIDEGVLYPAQELKLFMVTNNPDIAQTDCLFYAVAPAIPA